MNIAMLAPIAWRTPPRHYGPWENVAALLTEGLVACGHDVTLFATADSQTSAKLHAVCPQGYEERHSLIPKVWECLHISELFERADAYDIIHNHFDYLPLTYSSLTATPVVTTIHRFSSPGILPVHKKYNGKTFYVAISDAETDAVETAARATRLAQFAEYGTAVRAMENKPVTIRTLDLGADKQPVGAGHARQRAVVRRHLGDRGHGAAPARRRADQ